MVPAGYESGFTVASHVVVTTPNSPTIVIIHVRDVIKLLPIWQPEPFGDR